MKIFLLLFLLTFSAPLLAEEFYFKNPPTHRYLGNDQGNVGSCQAEADVTALENAFWQRGYTVKLSTFHRHAFNWHDDSSRQEKEEDFSLRLKYKTEDIDLLKKLGGVIPYYMLPDDKDGYNPYMTGHQPYISEIMAYDPEYKPFNVSLEGYSFRSGYSNSITVENLKELIKSGAALSLSVDGDFLMGSNFDDVTGFINKSVNLEQFAKEETSHSVAIVGFDDSLYADYGYPEPGAIIIKNSWNDNKKRLASLRKKDLAYETQEQLHKMKYKISANEILPGYYAIPYAYLRLGHLSPDRKGIFVRKYNIDYAGFAEQYYRLENRYEVVLAPYVCAPSFHGTLPSQIHHGKKLVMRFGNTLLELLRAGISPEDKKKHEEVFKRILNLQMSVRGSHTGRDAQFNYTKLSKHKGLNIDRARDFYSGQFNDYFCGYNNDDSDFKKPHFLYPNISHYENPKVQENIKELSVNFYSITNWWNFLRDLFVMEVKNEVPKNMPIH